jgi:2-polyprenyl-3-methyl-5-hydroxy-6-metoxy-1,4-benzoquinol methylase
MPNLITLFPIIGIMDNSLERIIPDLIDKNDPAEEIVLQLHLDRYHYAGRSIVPGTVADIACGVGYGTHLIATQYGSEIDSMYGVDIDVNSIEFAISHYNHPLITFVNANVSQFKPAVPLNNIISLETIEHLVNPALFIQQISKLLATGGRFIASVPITPSMDANPYHLHDFTRDSFRKMFQAAGFRELDSFIQKQSYNPLTLINRKNIRHKNIRNNLPGYYLKHPQKLLSRALSLLKDGFCNKYFVGVFEKLPN